MYCGPLIKSLSVSLSVSLGALAFTFEYVAQTLISRNVSLMLHGYIKLFLSHLNGVIDHQLHSEEACRA